MKKIGKKIKGQLLNISNIDSPFIGKGQNRKK